MKGKEDLFQLIRAMSSSEKRYFTLDAQKSGKKGSRYLELFQLINAMEEYDEAPLKKRFPKSLPFDKGYLYDAIMRAMRDYHSRNSRSARLKERLLDARYLFERSLYDQCEVRLEEARQFALDLEDHLSLLELNREFRRLALVTRRRGFEKVLNTLAEEEQHLLRRVAEEVQYLKISEQLFSQVFKQFVLRDPEEEELFRKQFPEQVFERSSMPEAAIARLKYFQGKALYNQLLGNFEKAMKSFSDVVAWWEAHPKYKEEEYYRYIGDFSNLLHAYISNGQGSLLPQLIKQLESAQPDTENARRILFQKVAIYRLISHINLGVKEPVDPLMREIAEGLDKFNVPTAMRSALIFNMAILLFTRGRFADCLLWCSRLIGDRKYKYRQDIRTAVYLLNLMATFELGDLQLLEAGYRSTYRYLNKEDRLRDGNFEMLVLENMRRLIFSAPEELAGLWRSFSEDLQAIHHDPERKVRHGMDELCLLWVQSHIDRKPMTGAMGGRA